MANNVFWAKARRFTASILIILLILLPIFASVPFDVRAEDVSKSEVRTLMDEIIAFNLGKIDGSAEEWINGGLSEAPQLNEWYAIGISKAFPQAELSAYADALEEYLSNNTVGSAVTRQKYGLALIACGRADSEYISDLVDKTAGKQGIMSYIFALNLLSNGAPSEQYTRENVIPVLLKLACEGGGWSLGGKTADVDVTAMAVQALSPYYNVYGEVKTAVDTALELLSEKQEDDGGFSSFGDSNPESSAQVIIALASLGRDPMTDSAFIKNGKTPFDAIKDYRLSDGSYSHLHGAEYNLAATSQIFMAFAAMNCEPDGSDFRNASFFVFAEHTEELSVLDYSIADTLPDRNKTDSGSKDNENTGDNSQPSDAPSVEDENTGAYKLPVCIGIVALAIVICFIMVIKKKRAISDYLIVAIVAAGLCAAVTFIDITLPEDYVVKIEKEDPIGTVTVEIVCDTQLTGRNDAVILGKTAVEIEEGETVYDLLMQLARANGITVVSSGGGISGGVYIQGISGLHEMDYGDLSGWSYTVNGERISAACDKWVLRDGDTVVWTYSDSAW